jgi:hypothetical protein
MAAPLPRRCAGFRAPAPPREGDDAPAWSFNDVVALILSFMRNRSDPPLAPP